MIGNPGTAAPTVINSNESQWVSKLGVEQVDPPAPNRHTLKRSQWRNPFRKRAERTTGLMFSRNFADFDCFDSIWYYLIFLKLFMIIVFCFRYFSLVPFDPPVPATPLFVSCFITSCVKCIQTTRWIFHRFTIVRKWKFVIAKLLGSWTLKAFWLPKRSELANALRCSSSQAMICLKAMPVIFPSLQKNMQTYLWPPHLPPLIWRSMQVCEAMQETWPLFEVRTVWRCTWTLLPHPIPPPTPLFLDGKRSVCSTVKVKGGPIYLIYTQSFFNFVCQGRYR